MLSSVARTTSSTVSARMIALIVSTMAWVFELASVSRVWASSAMANPAGVAHGTGVVNAAHGGFPLYLCFTPRRGAVTFDRQRVGLAGTWSNEPQWSSPACRYWSRRWILSLVVRHAWVLQRGFKESVGISVIANQSWRFIVFLVSRSLWLGSLFLPLAADHRALLVKEPFDIQDDQ